MRSAWRGSSADARREKSRGPSLAARATPTRARRAQKAAYTATAGSRARRRRRIVAITTSSSTSTDPNSRPIAPIAPHPARPSRPSRASSDSLSYASAHLDDVESELVVSADHLHVHHHPLAIREVRRILLEHLRALGTTGDVACAGPNH